MAEKSVTTRRTEELILLYKDHPCLWDLKHKDYYNKSRRAAAIRNISAAFNSTEQAVEYAIRSLRSSYNRQLKKISDSRIRSCGAEVYVPRWMYFNKLSFLMDNVVARKTRSNISVSRVYTKVPSEVDSVKEEVIEDFDQMQGAVDSQTSSSQSPREDYASLISDFVVVATPESEHSEDICTQSSDLHPSSTIHLSSPPSSISDNGRKRTVDGLQTYDDSCSLLNVAVTKLNSNCRNVAECFGQWVGAYLNSMSREKQTHAMARINSVLFEIMSSDKQKIT